MRVTGVVALVLGLLIYLLAGSGPLEGPVGLTIGLLAGTFFSVAGAILIGKSFLAGGE